MKLPYEEVTENASGGNANGILAGKKDFLRVEVKKPGYVITNMVEINSLDLQCLGTLPCLLCRFQCF